MLFSSRFLNLLALSGTLVTACPHLSHLRKRQESLGPGVNASEVTPRFWAYEASYDWGRLNPDWQLCQIGSQQSPIPLRFEQGLSRDHVLSFDFPSTSTGDFHNWGYGPAYTLDQTIEGDYTSLPSAQFDENGVNETVYLASWHIHAPADHSVQGDRSKAELHLVMADSQGDYRAVLAIRMDPGNANSTFVASMPPMIGFNATEPEAHNTGVELNMNDALDEINRFSDFWTYRGSLTSPPCTEGIRWFVARNVLFVSTQQMKNILRVSAFSARAEQEVWEHDINV